MQFSFRATDELTKNILDFQSKNGYGKTESLIRLVKLGLFFSDKKESKSLTEKANNIISNDLFKTKYNNLKSKFNINHPLVDIINSKGIEINGTSLHSLDDLFNLIYDKSSNSSNTSN